MPASQPFGPWNPGVTSKLTPELWRMCTIFRRENVLTTFDQAIELKALTGLAPSEFVAFRPERLVLHELLLRVMTDYEVPDPEHPPDRHLGTRFRTMLQAILERHALPRMDWLVGDYAPARAAIADVVANELPAAFSGPLDDRLFEQWRAKASADGLSAAAYGALTRVISVIHRWKGRLSGRPELLQAVITGLACNVHGGRVIADRVAELLAEAAAAEHFRPLPSQDRPIAFSIKGAAAAGKTSMRPRYRALVTRMGANWGDFARITPDIFRRSLLDIESLAPAYRNHFAAFTDHELAVVEEKLDRHLARKAELQTMPHLLVDRLRLDSFAADSNEQKQLLARLENRRLIHYLFLITPPETTIERAWQAGVERGRYQPVDRLLVHNVTAYRGMQTFFLARALGSEGLNQFYEFVDNDVPQGDAPLAVAFGWNRELNILDVALMVNIERYGKINVNARRAEDLRADPQALRIDANLGFLRTCIRRFPVLNLADRDTARVYARFEGGRLVWKDQATADAIDDARTLAALRVVVPELLARDDTQATPSERYLDPDRFPTLGRWATRVVR